MFYKTITMDTKDRISILTLNSPSTLNALNNDILSELTEVINNLDQNPSIDIIIITGAGKAFVAGADIGYMKNLSPAEAIAYSERTTDIYKIMYQSKKVFIAAINGYALGAGCELALACDLRIASTKAKLGLPETSFGIIPGGMGTQLLPRIVGISKAKELIFTGDILTASDALSIELVNKVVEHDNLIEQAIQIAYKICKNSINAVGYAKEAINIGYNLELSSAVHLERNLFGLCFNTVDQKEKMKAFVDKTTSNKN